MRWTVMALCALIFTSCSSRKLEKDKVIGKYVWNDNRLDTLDIRGDNRYEYWHFKYGQKIPNRGEWVIGENGKEIEFKLENFPFIEVHEEGKSWIAPLKWEGEEVRIIFSESPDLYLTKVQPSR